MRISTLASGSGGNSVFVESNGTRLLIDAGLSCRALEVRLAAIGIDPDTLAAVAFTHEHVDHVRGAAVLARRHKVPLYFNPLTRAAVPDLHKCEVREFETGVPFRINGLELSPFSISHDAADPVGFVVGDGNFKTGLASDLGFVTRLVAERLRRVNALLLESNHDPYLLEVGPYPRELKQRVGGKRGHLANGDCGDFLAEAAGDELSHVILLHLSETNNAPEIALAAARQGLDAAGASDVDLQAASQHEPCRMVTLAP